MGMTMSKQTPNKFDEENGEVFEMKSNDMYLKGFCSDYDPKDLSLEERPQDLLCTCSTKNEKETTGFESGLKWYSKGSHDEREQMKKRVRFREVLEDKDDKYVLKEVFKTPSKYERPNCINKFFSKLKNNTSEEIEMENLNTNKAPKKMIIQTLQSIYEDERSDQITSV